MPSSLQAAEEAEQEERVRVAGALRLLDRLSPGHYLREWTERIAAAKTVETPGTQTGLIFRIGEEWFSLPTRIFQEVAENAPLHSLPHRRGGVVAGLVSVRGELLICASLAVLLGVTPAAPAEEVNARSCHRLLVANRLGSRLAFPADQVSAVHRYHPEDLRPVPATLGEKRVKYTIGLLPWRDRTVGCLDDELLFQTLERELA